jgi:tRNA/tmRNA/rRNA uracil-C5-methylase (TrmA/RlmC/RlmD family)
MGTVNRTYKRIFGRRNQIILMVLFLSWVSLPAQKNINQILRSYKNDQGVQTFRFSDAGFKKWISSEKELKSYIEDAEVIMFSENKDISKEDKARILTTLTKNKYELLTEYREKKYKAQLFIQENNSIIEKIYAEMSSGDMKVYFIFNGRIWPDELGDLGLNFGEGQKDQILMPWEK